MVLLTAGIAVGFWLLTFAITSMITRSPFTGAAWSVLLGLAAYGILTVVAGLFAAAHMEPLPPVSKTSILGKRAVGAARVALAVMVFFGTTMVTTLISIDSTVGVRRGSLQVPQQLVDVGTTVLIPVLYVFWLWVAVDLLRLRHTGRLRALVRLRRSLPQLPRDAQRVAGWLLTAPWWALVTSFITAPVAVYFLGDFVRRLGLPQ